MEKESRLFLDGSTIFGGCSIEIYKNSPRELRLQLPGEDVTRDSQIQAS